MAMAFMIKPICRVGNVEDNIVQGFAVRKRIGFLPTGGTDWVDADLIYHHFIFARKSPAVITLTILLILSVKKCASPVKK